MDRNRLLMIAAVLAAVVVVALGFVVGVNPQLTAAADARAQNASVAQQNETLRAGIVTLKSKFSKLDSLTTQLATSQKSVPSDADSPAFITEINDLASKTGVAVTTLTLSDAQAYVAPVAAESTTSSAAAGALPVAPASVTNAAISGKNFSVIPVSITVGGTYAQALSFLAAVHTGDRLFLVTAFSGSADSSADGTSGSWTVAGYIYALADADSVQETQQSTTSTAADAASASSSTDTAAGK